MLQALQRNTETLAVDTERASGFRYSQRAYLVQIGLAAGSIYLVDPVALDESSPGWNHDYSYFHGARSAYRAAAAR